MRSQQRLPKTRGERKKIVRLTMLLRLPGRHSSLRRSRGSKMCPGWSVDGACLLFVLDRGVPG
jgi:hypothetical protein